MSKQSKLSKVAERLNYFISAKEIDKCDIAEALNWNRKTVYNQLNGACEISIDLILGICRLYPELNADFVLLRSDKMEDQLSDSAQRQIDELKIKIREKDAQIKLLKQLIK